MNQAQVREILSSGDRYNFEKEERFVKNKDKKKKKNKRNKREKPEWKKR